MPQITGNNSLRFFGRENACGHNGICGECAINQMKEEPKPKMNGVESFSPRSLCAAMWEGEAHTLGVSLQGIDYRESSNDMVFKLAI